MSRSLRDRLHQIIFDAGTPKGRLFARRRTPGAPHAQGLIRQPDIEQHAGDLSTPENPQRLFR